MKHKIIYNCHTHIFTHENIPNDFFPLNGVRLARRPAVRWVLKGLMRWLVKYRRFQRYSAYLDSAFKKMQQENFEELQKYYPSSTMFVILPMDMAYMAAGKVIEDIDAQHEELAKLARNKKFRDNIIPFAHIDPRREDSLQRLQQLVEKDIPLIAHCSPGNVNSKGMSMEKAHSMADPDNYRVVMDRFPKLRICLGHFGGISEWEKHLDEFSTQMKPTWLSKIRNMMNSGRYPNLYADISYTIFNFQENAPLLSALLEEEMIAGKVLFGSDFYMVKTRNYSEKRLSIDLRSVLGEEKFWLIANKNPKVFLQCKRGLIGGN
jgi:uncharacterized protein